MAFGNALSNALSGMNAASVQVQVRSHNIANATTEGYARRDVNISARATGGVRIVTVERAESSFVTANRLRADAGSQDATTRADALAEVERVLGTPDDAQGLFPVFSRFETAIDDLAATPEAPSYQQAAVNAARDLVGTFNRIGDAVTTLRTQADRDIGATVADVNAALAALAKLNGAATVGGATEINDLAEQRRGHIDTIASALEIVVVPAERGQIRIQTAEGVVLLSETARQVGFRSGGIVAPGETIASGHLSGLTVDGIDITPGGGAQGIRQGSLAALFATRDDTVPTFGDRIDALATELVDRFANTAADTTIAPGGEGLFRSNGTGPGAASRLSLATSVDPSEGGALWRMRDGVNAATPGPAAGIGVLAGLQSAMETPRALPAVTDSPAALSLSETIASLASVIGTQRIDAAANAAAATATARGLADQELAETGVNTDQELQSLLLIEQAYAANARVVQVVSDMMARLMEI
jgi:flagellar hook-associated protein 1 FlgK